MITATVQLRVQQLRQCLQSVSQTYYTLDAPTMPNEVYEVYDRLYCELQELETRYPELISLDSSTQRVGQRSASQFTSVRHIISFSGMKNAFNIEKFAAWQKDWQCIAPGDEFEYVCELKVDGAALALTYENGILVRGATQRNDITDEEITENVKMIRSIPLRLNLENPPALVEVRGKAFLGLGVFEQINRERIQVGKDLFANPRTAAAGTLRQLDSKIVAQYPLDFFAYTLYIPRPILNAQNPIPKTQWESLEILQKMGFQVNPSRTLCRSLQELKEYYDCWDTERLNLPYMTDGVVAKLNSFELQKKLGFAKTSGFLQKVPRWAVTIKYLSSHCPECWQPMVKQAGEAVTRCINTSCPAILRGALTHRASQDSINVNGLCETIVLQLVDRQPTSSVTALYDLTLLEMTEKLGITQLNEAQLMTILESSFSNKASILISQNLFREAPLPLSTKNQSFRLKLESLEQDGEIANVSLLPTDSNLDTASLPSSEALKNIDKEQFSYDYIRMLTSLAGFEFKQSGKIMDNQGVDADIQGTIERQRCSLQMQIKCTSVAHYDEDCVKYPLPRKNYDELREERSDIPFILVVVLVPNNIDELLIQSECATLLNCRAYWISLRGKPVLENKTTVTVHLPCENWIRPQSLKALMQRVASGEKI